MKKTMAIFVTVALAACLMAITAFADASLTVSASETAVTMGDEIVVSADVSDNTGFSYCMGTVTYDSSVLELTALDDGLIPGSTKNVNTGKLSYASSTNVEGDGTLFTATFKVLDTAAVGSSTVSVSVKMRAADGSWLMNGTSGSASVTVGSSHNWSDWTETKPATETETGAKTRTCSRCGETETQEIPPLGHMCTLRFDANGGTGSMENALVDEDDNYILPACGFTAPEGKEFDKWNVNGTEYNAGDYITVSAAATITAQWKEQSVTSSDTEAYVFVEGMHGTWSRGVSDLYFKVNGDYAKFIGLEMDGAPIDPANYTSASGSTVLYLNSSYLETLSAGTHNLKAVYVDGATETDFTIKSSGQIIDAKPEDDSGEKTKMTDEAGDQAEPVGADENQSPAEEKTTETGDESNIVLWSLMVLISAAGLSGAMVYNRKRKEQ